jgi:hypothetical protein
MKTKNEKETRATRRVCREKRVGKRRRDKKPGQPVGCPEEKRGWAVGPWYGDAAGGKRVQMRNTTLRVQGVQISTRVLGYEEYRLALNIRV